jgi:AAA family ATP:ADP antiporter
MATKTEKSGLEKFLTIFTEVSPGEGITALLLTANIFLLLTAYYVIKPVREGLILAMDSGAEYKSYMSGAIAIALLGAVPAYASFAKKLPRNKLIVGVTLFFTSHLVLFYLLSKVEAAKSSIGLVFFLWVGIFNMMVVAQFWAFANDVYNEEQGKRLFALIGIGASAGAALGAAIAKFIIPLIGLFQMLLVAGAILAVCAAISQVVHVRETAAAAKDRKDVKKQLKVTVAADSSAMKDAVDKAKKAAEAGTAGAFGMVFRYRYLLLMAAFSLLFTFINTNGEYILGAIVSQAADDLIASGGLDAAKKGDWIGAWFGDFFLYVNVLGMILQSFVVSRLVKYGGLKLALFFFPMVALLDAFALAVWPLLMTARIGKTFENASDYSVNNTARNMLWLPTTKAMKYQAKQAVDTFFVRMGDVGSALTVALFAVVLKIASPRLFAIVNLVLVVVLLVVCWMILREQEVIKKMRASGELIDEDEV